MPPAANTNPVSRLLMNQRISISLELANYLYSCHLDCVTDGTGYDTPEDIEPKIKRFRKSLDKARVRARVRAKVDSLLTPREADERESARKKVTIK